MTGDDFNLARALKMKRTVSLVLFALVFLLIGILISEIRLSHSPARKAFVIEEPLLIEAERQNSYSVLPAGSVLYLDKSWPEGHSTYHVYFHFKGDFKSTSADGSVIAPLWLRTVDSSEAGSLACCSFKSKEDDKAGPCANFP